MASGRPRPFALPGTARAWLLAFALCLPLAQWSAAVHALRHLQGSEQQDREAPASLHALCGLCLAGAALGGSAPLPAAPAAPPAVESRGAVPQPPPATAPAAPFPARYRSRAPPRLDA